MLRYFASGPDKPPLADRGEIDRLYKRYRFRVFLWLVIGYGFFYICRLSLPVAKRPLLEAGVFMFWIGAGIVSILLAMIAWHAKPNE